jgi:hypothetical protein
MNYPTDFMSETQAFPVERLGPLGREAYQKVLDQGYDIRVGLTPELADAIAQTALEPSIREYCPNDSAERFTDRAATQRWLSKGRAAFLLVKTAEDGNLQLAGYGWVGARANSHVPGASSTFAIRIGEIGQGKGLAAPFSRIIIAGAAILYGADKLWLDAWDSNGAAVHVYHKIGAVEIDRQSTQRPRPSGETVTDTRVYMSLPDELLNP